MQSLVAQFALFPYVAPRQVAHQRVDPKFATQDTLQTLFVGFDSPFNNDPKEMFRMFDTMNKVLTSIFQLQSDQLEVPDTTNLHSGSLSLFLRYLADTSIDIYSLCPIPKFDAIEIHQLIVHCIDIKIPPDRSAWAIHHFCIQRNTTPDVLSKTLQAEPNFYKNDPDYFAKLSYALYIRNLVNHVTYLQWMISELPPENMIIFKNEILKTHSILLSALQSKSMQTYLQKFRNSLLLNKSQLIQFSILSASETHAQDYQFQPYLEDYRNALINKRTQEIHSLAKSRLSFISMFRNIFFHEYPNFDIEQFRDDIRVLVQYATPEELSDLALEMCKSIFWIHKDYSSLSSIIAYLIKSLGAEFPLPDFIDFLYDNVESIENFRFLFGELQVFGLFDYDDFKQYIFENGYKNSKRKETAQIFANLPTYNRSKKILSRLDFAFSELMPDLKINETVKKIFEDFDNNIEKAVNLPYTIRHLIGLTLLDSKQDITSTAKIFIKLGLFTLIPDLFTPGKSVKLSFKLVPMIKKLFPVFATHNKINELMDSVLQNQNIQQNREVLIYIYENYKKLAALNPFRQQLIKILNSAKQIAIDHDEIFNLFHKYSYLCSLHVFDAIHAIKTPTDFVRLLPYFFSDLLQFDLLTVDALFDFFCDFSESKVLSRSSYYFIKQLINIIIDDPHLYQKEHVQMLLFQFFTRVFAEFLIEPEDYLCAIFGVKKSKAKSQLHQTTATFLVRLFLKVVDLIPKSFTVNSCLTEKIVNGFSQSFPDDTNLLSEMLQILRTFPSPIITKDMFKFLDAPPTSNTSQFAAAMFSLLPGPMHTQDFDDLVRYFKTNVVRQTSTFWTLWLKYKPYYRSGFPVTINQNVDKDALASYRLDLISSFSNLLFRAAPGEEKTMIYLNCWTLLCDNIAIGKAIVDQIIDHLKSNKISLYPMLIDFMHQSLKLITDKTYETLCDALCNYKYDESQLELFVKTSASVFAVYISRFYQGHLFVAQIANKLLEWLPKLYEINSHEIEFVIDVFNYAIACTTKEDITFQASLHKKIKDNYLKAPTEIRDLLILNQPPQTFKTVKEPLYSDFKLPDAEPPAPSFGGLATSFEPDHTDNTFTSPFDNSSIFGNYEDEFQTWF